MRKTLSLLFALAFIAQAFGYDFEADGIYYNITSSEGKTVAVTTRDRNFNSYSGTVTIPASVTNAGTTYSVTCIGDSAFYKCTDLTGITIPSSVTSIGNYAFSGLTALEDFYVSWSTPLEIPTELFQACDRSKFTLHVPAGTKALYAAADGWKYFGTIVENVVPASQIIYYTSSDGNIVTPNNATDFGSNILSNTYENGQGKIVFDADVTLIGVVSFEGCSSLTSITIPESVTSIKTMAFAGCAGLTSITIPKSVTSIEMQAFYGCSSLTSISIPKSVTSIEKDVFNSCTGLKSITIPEGVTSIGATAFYGCFSLTSITIPKSVTSIEDDAFASCIGLKDCYVSWGAPLAIPTYVFRYCSLSQATLHVPFGSKEKYAAADGWKKFGTIVEYDPTAIDVVEAAPVQNDVMYNLNGTRTAARKGIVLMNGKKAFFK